MDKKIKLGNRNRLTNPEQNLTNKKADQIIIIVIIVFNLKGFYMVYFIYKSQKSKFFKYRLSRNLLLFHMTLHYFT